MDDRVTFPTGSDTGREDMLADAERLLAEFADDYAEMAK